MRRGLGVLVVGLAVCVPAASSMSTAGWKGLKYFDYDSQQLVVATDGAWKGGRVVRTLSNQKLLDISGPGLRRTTPKWFWANTCGSSPQFVTFTRQVRAPGDPKEGYLFFDLGFGRDLPFKSGEFLINGKEVERIVVPPGKFSGFPKYFSGPLPAKALKAFNYGMNTLTIRAERKALPKGQGCNSPNRLVGVYATLSLTFKPDLIALPSPYGVEQAVRISAGASGGGVGKLRFRNAGPSGSPGGRLIFNWAASGAIETAFSPASFIGLEEPFSNCKGQGLIAGEIECQYGDFPVGKLSTVTVVTGARATARFTPDTFAVLSLQWQILPAGGDDKAANNYFTHTIVLCGTTTKEPRCANAK
jgi:hypothetical protein